MRHPGGTVVPERLLTRLQPRLSTWGFITIGFGAFAESEDPLAEGVFPLGEALGEGLAAQLYRRRRLRREQVGPLSMDMRPEAQLALGEVFF
jgi:hypothetical protein